MKVTHFSRYADMDIFIEVFTSQIEQHWDIIASRDLDKLYALWTKSIGLPMHQKIGAIEEKDPKKYLDKVGSIVIAHAILGEALKRWPECYLLDVEFMEEHAFIVDKQIRYHEYTGDKACFFALCHVGTSMVCEKSEIERDDGISKPYTFTNPGESENITILNLLADVLRNMREAASQEKVAQTRFTIETKELFRGAEAIMCLQDFIN